MPDYSQAKIYKIECNMTNDVYYGSTTKRLTRRLAGHKYDAKFDAKNCASRQILDRNDYFIELIENYPCNSKRELETRERWWIENNQCINNKLPIVSEEETKRYRLDYYKKHKEHYKQYRDNHKEVVREYNKEYRHQNKEKIKAFHSTKIKCECGCYICPSSKGRHIISKKHTDLLGHQSLGNN